MTYKNILLALLVALLAACNSEKRPSRPEFDPNYPDVHDPVLAVGEDGRYYIFSTGVGVSVMSSADLKTWRQEQPVFDREEIPQWAKPCLAIGDTPGPQISVIATGNGTSTTPAPPSEGTEVPSDSPSTRHSTLPRQTSIGSTKVPLSFHTLTSTSGMPSTQTSAKTI